MSETIEKQLRVRKITRGTVLDHIPGGRALTVLKLLGISVDSGEPITIAMNIPFGKIGKKDIVKLENVFLSQEDFNKLALIAPKATINRIEEMKIADKSYVSIPDELGGFIRCINPTCITNKKNEPIEGKFSVIDKKPLVIKCEYCGRIMDQETITANLIYE